MPTRIYKADTPTGACVTCRDGIARWEGLLQPFLALCPECDSPIHVVIQPVTIGEIDPRLGAEPIYMSQLVKPGDANPRANPANYVSGPHSWRRKVDQAQREGVRFMSSAEINDDRSPWERKRAEREERNGS